MNRTHTTQPAHSGTYHYWEVRGPRGAVSLSLLHSREFGFDLALLPPSIAKRVEPTDGGHWVFDVVQSHRESGTGWGCSRHGDACDMAAIVSQIAEPMWARLTAVGVTDGAVYAELERLLAAVQEEAA